MTKVGRTFFKTDNNKFENVGCIVDKRVQIWGQMHSRDEIDGCNQEMIQVFFFYFFFLFSKLNFLFPILPLQVGAASACTAPI